MDKQTTAAFILIGVILVFWLYLNSPEPQPIPPKSQDTTQVAIDTLEKDLALFEKKIEQSIEKVEEIEKEIAKIDINDMKKKIQEKINEKLKDIPEKIVVH